VFAVLQQYVFCIYASHIGNIPWQNHLFIVNKKNFMSISHVIFLSSGDSDYARRAFQARVSVEALRDVIQYREASSSPDA
jgi:hypothetical protein